MSTKTLSIALLILPSLFNAVALWPELTISRSPINDAAFHIGASKAMADHPSLDQWYAPVAMGYPLWRIYQPLPHLFTGLAMRAARPVASPEAVFTVLEYALLCLMPMAFFGFARAVGLSVLASALTAALSVTVAGAGDYGAFGIGLNSYIWRGYGLYPQLWGMVVGLPAAAFALRTISARPTNLRLILAGVALGVAFLTHGFVGFILTVSVVGLALIQSADSQALCRHAIRCVIMLGAFALTTAWFLVPLFIDPDLSGGNPWGASSKAWMAESFGLGKILGDVVIHGNLFDAGRYPVLTLLVFAGALMCAFQARRKLMERSVLALAAFWLLIWFGRPTWGRLLDIIPSNFHLHRFEIGFELAAVLLAALALEKMCWWIAGRRTA